LPFALATFACAKAQEARGSNSPFCSPEEGAQLFPVQKLPEQKGGRSSPPERQEGVLSAAQAAEEGALATVFIPCCCAKGYLPYTSKWRWLMNLTTKISYLTEAREAKGVKNTIKTQKYAMRSADYKIENINL
jgi:hypothetical protein